MLRLVARVAAVVLIAAPLTATPAAADWNNTRWGMTREEVLANYPLAQADPKAPEARPRLEHPAGLEWIGRTWDVVGFNFDAQRGLDTIAMETEASQEEIVATLTARFGPPFDAVSVGTLHLVYFRDPVSGDQVYVTSSEGVEGRIVSVGPPKD